MQFRVQRIEQSTQIYFIMINISEWMKFSEFQGNFPYAYKRKIRSFLPECMYVVHNKAVGLCF